MQQPTIHSQGTPRRIAYMHDTNVFGGMETLQINMLRHLDRSRFAPSVVISPFDGPMGTPPELLALLAASATPVIKPPHPGTQRGVSALREIAGTAQALRRAQIELVHIQTWHPAGARKATLAARLAGVRGIVRSEHMPPTYRGGRLTRQVASLFDLLTYKIVVDSDSNRDEQLQLIGRSPQKVIRSYCGIDAFMFNPQHNVAAAKARLGLNPDLPVVGNVGRLHEQKGQTYLLDAAAELLHSYGSFQLLVVGDGPLRAELLAKAEALGLNDYAHFVGFQADYVPFMEAMDVGVMSSLWEGFSISMQEFMALGKPMVVTNHRSFLEAFEHERHGLIVPTRDGAAMASAILRLLRDPELGRRLAQAALHRIRTEFSIQQHMRELMGLYEEILGVRRTTAAPAPQS
jgi:glycosyltransferase involved in cell wall biosynthesis